MITIDAVEDVEVAHAHVLAAACRDAHGEELKGEHAVDMKRCREALTLRQAR
jgi:hypothetical protein